MLHSKLTCRVSSARHLDAIGITNHNTFDVPQYQDIVDKVGIPVFPGIEVDLETGHLLVFTEPSDLADFSVRCSLLTTRIKSKEDYISYDEFVGVFPSFKKYLLIPHYEKNPVVPRETLAKFGNLLSAGEVSSPKKFMHCYRNQTDLVPVYFSDSRIHRGLEKFSNRQTYLGIGEITLSAIKTALKDKEKVKLDESERGTQFATLDGRLKLSTGLNVILGERSSGKSYTLNRIAEEFESVKYIRQFELLERDEERDEKRFSEYLSTNNSLVTDRFLGELKSCVDGMSTVDLERTNKRIDAYLESLFRRAKETEREDAFSKVKLFSEALFSIVGLDSLKNLISSVINILDNVEYKDIVVKHVAHQSLKQLALDLMMTHNSELEKCLKRVWANEVITTIKSELELRTAATPISDVDFYGIALERNRVSKFDQVCKLIKRQREISRTKLQSFQILAQARPFRSAMELKLKSGKTVGGFVEAFSATQKPYEFLLALRNIEAIPESDYFKFFCVVEYRILNRHGFDVSGGERSEFRLLQEISDAQQADILLIDEPESSFDNQFLKSEVNTLIRDISRQVPVVIVTHNSTVGASIQPDYLIYTKRNLDTTPVSYEIYSGFPTDKTLLGSDGKAMRNFDVMMNCLEAGPTAYAERGQTYEALKN